MIISCSNCNKQFKINLSLIPDNGRDVKCGSCNHVWFYKLEDNKTEPPPLIDNFADKKIEDEIDNKIVENINEPNDVSLEKEIDDRIYKTEDKIAEKQIPVKDKIKKNTSSKFFSYLVVSIISFVALIILIDTFKAPLINIFPGLEILLFNLFEILKDIKLFIIDLY
ncbi:zinc-ribbon domain-containing protein [Candidatus Pelagibacter bacterium nBUS_49]|uniref:zinc-ribbon domain-containing protein n=1 Tax=Candidatus Pelagibacter bacterium nBUS_49 TaxID=3374196 RepID=UPI003EBD28D4